MSILIKGMEMPKGEDLVISISSNGDVYIYDVDRDKFFISTAEALKIPTPHGRLIDSELAEHVVGMGTQVTLSKEERILAIQGLPTVIEEEKQK